MDEFSPTPAATHDPAVGLVGRMMRDCFDRVSPGAIDRYTTDGRIRAMYSSVVEAFPDACLSRLWYVVEGSRAVVGGVVTGTHLGTWRDVPATGRRFEVLSTVMVEVADGELVDLMVVTDSLGLAEQLGLVEPFAPKACELPQPPGDASGRTPCGDALLTRVIGRG
jgi:predicted ester cyclase